MRLSRMALWLAGMFAGCLLASMPTLGQPSAPEFDDGASKAPDCAIQYPSLLTSYKIRPKWRVAGVDYCVGFPSTAKLLDPRSISIPGVAVDKRSKVITVTGANITLDGYDFAGWGIVTTAANTRLVRSNFDGASPAGAQTSVISGTATASNLYVGYSVIDGQPKADFLVEMEGPGLTIEYSWLKNSNSDIVGRHGNNGGDINIRNNLVEQAALGAGAHGDYLQVYGPMVQTTKIMFNTTWQWKATPSGTQGFICDNTSDGEFAYNTMIANQDGRVSYLMSVQTKFLRAKFVVHDNYFDQTRAFGFAYPAVGPNDAYPLTIFTNNVNLVTGAVSQDTEVPASAGRTAATPR